MNLNKQVDSIQSREDFISFVRALLEDLKEDPNDWENPSLENYLKAVAAWVEDMDGYYQNQGKPVAKNPDWKMLGEILLAAKFYE